MIKPVYRICPACLGEGLVKTNPNPNSNITPAIVISYNIQCEVCKGKGMVPTGEFTLEDDPTFPIINEINEFPHLEEKEMMLRRALKH